MYRHILPKIDNANLQRDLVGAECVVVSDYSSFVVIEFSLKAQIGLIGLRDNKTILQALRFENGNIYAYGQGFWHDVRVHGYIDHNFDLKTFKPLIDELWLVNTPQFVVFRDDYLRSGVVVSADNELAVEHQFRTLYPDYRGNVYCMRVRNGLFGSIPRPKRK